MIIVLWEYLELYNKALASNKDNQKNNWTGDISPAVELKHIFLGVINQICLCFPLKNESLCNPYQTWLCAQLSQ